MIKIDIFYINILFSKYNITNISFFYSYISRYYIYKYYKYN